MKRILPSLWALLGSAVAAAGLYCAVTFVICMGWGGPDAHPIAIPVSILGGLGCLCLFIFVCYFYFRLWKTQNRRWLTLADISCFLLPLFPFLHLWSVVARHLAAL